MKEEANKNNKTKIRKSGCLKSLLETADLFDANIYYESKAVVDKYMKDHEEETVSNGRRLLKEVVYNLMVRIFSFDCVKKPIADAEKFCEFVRETYDRYYTMSFELGEKTYIQEDYGWCYFRSDKDRETYAEIMTKNEIEKIISHD